jgi:hypothetical protein
MVCASPKRARRSRYIFRKVVLFEKFLERNPIMRVDTAALSCILVPTDHFVKRWGRQSHEKDTAVDPGASAGVGSTGLMIPPLHKVVTGHGNEIG